MNFKNKTGLREKLKIHNKTKKRFKEEIDFKCKCYGFSEHTIKKFKRLCKFEEN